MKYDVSMVVYGESVNEVASKILSTAYVGDFDIEELQVNKQSVDAQPNPIDNNPDETFKFPKVVELVEGLKKNGDRFGSWD